MTYWQIAKQHEKNIPVFVEIYNKALLVPGRDSFDVGIDVYCRWDIATKLTADYLRLITTPPTNAAVKIETYLHSCVLGAGPKVFRPTSAQLFALEKMKLNLTVTDFAMPYDTIVVELPDEYKRARLPDAHCSILHLHGPTKFFIHSLVYDKTSYKSWWPGKPDAELEVWLKDDFWVDFGELPVQPEEKSVEPLIRRAILNYCLLLDEVGLKSNGPAVPNQYSQLVKWCAKSNEHTLRNRAMLQAQPMLFELKRPTELVRIVGSASELPPNEPGRVMGPHARRGHYRMQPHGPGNCERKRIRIPPTIVNAHLLLGGPPDATYKT